MITEKKHKITVSRTSIGTRDAMGNNETTSTVIASFWGKIIFVSGQKSLDGAVIFKDKVKISCHASDSAAVKVGDLIGFEDRTLVVIGKESYTFKCTLVCENLYV